MGLTVHFEVLNQLGTPMLYSSTLATRPAAGITGRIFYRTDSPFGIYRDNGTTWDQISTVGGGGISGSGTATQVAYWDTSSSITSNSGLYYDTTNTRLGIGNATPGAALDAHQASGTIIQANATALGNSLQSFQLQGTGKWQIGNVYNAGGNYFRIYDQLNSVERIKQQNTGQLDQLGWIVNTNTVTGITGSVTTQTPNTSFTNNFTYNSGISTVASANLVGVDIDNIVNYSGANTINQTSYNTAALLRTIMTFGSAAASITYTQATGIRTLANKQSIYIQDGANSGTISHYANLQIFGDQKLSTGTTTFTNRYQLLINDLAEFSAGNTYTNRWGIYQSGASNTNYFNGKIITGSSTTVGTDQLDVTGTGVIKGGLAVKNSTNTQTGFSCYSSTITFDGAITCSVSSNFAINDIRSNGSTNPILFYGNGRQTGFLTFSNAGVPFSFTSGTVSFVSISNYSFAPTTGTGIFNVLAINPTINQTGSSSGVSRAILIQPTITAAVDWRAIEITTGGVYVNTSSVSASAILQADSTTKGFLPPRMTLAQRNSIATPTSGLLVINTTDATLDGYDGTAAAWYQSVRSDNGYVKVNATTSGTVGIASGQYLQINVNGTNYKIALFNV